MAGPEEAGRVAGSVVEGLKAQPLALALVVVNLMFLFGGVFFLHELGGETASAQLRKDELMVKLVERCGQPQTKE
jgi:hypothetical protein